MGKKKTLAKPGSVKKPRGTVGKSGGPGSTLETETVTYGVAPSEYSIQAQINWLTAPPSTNDKKQPNSSQPPPSKKPQRGYHRDVCDACGEGECLMFCDKCPASYHAICDDPPLPPEDFEVLGVNWKCRKCRSLVSDTSETQEEENETELPLPEIEETEFSANLGPVGKFFAGISPYYKNTNPAQFQLPKDLPAYDYPFPGTSRHILKKGRPRTSVVDVEHGLVPKPVVFCFHCQKSCRVGALIQCDKCDVFFHLDCIDPPLTTIPATVWICPLHPEPYLESTQLTSIALSERIKIWDNCEKPVHGSSIILNFLRKGSRRNPMFRRKRAIPMATSYDVPEMVQNCYNDGVDYMQERFGKLQTLAAACEIERVKITAQEEVDQYRKKVIEYYLPAAKIMSEQRLKVEALRVRNEAKVLEGARQLQEVEKETETAEKDAINGQAGTEIRPQRKKRKHNELPEESEGSAIPTIMSSASLLERLMPFLSEDATRSVSAAASNGSNKPDEERKWDQKQIDLERKKAIEDLVVANEIKSEIELIMQMTKPNRAEQILKWAKKAGISEFFPESATTRKSNPGSPEKKAVSMQALKKYLSSTAATLPTKSNAKKSKITKELIPPQPKLPNPYKLSPKSDRPKPFISFLIENKAAVIDVRKPNIWIGSGKTNCWRLTETVPCQRIEDQHARLFYNPHENVWEILNYSSSGIYVNGTLFGFKTTDHIPASASVPSERLQELQEMSNKRLDEFILNSGDELQAADAVSSLIRVSFLDIILEVKSLYFPILFTGYLFLQAVPHEAFCEHFRG
ncbi:unnamed protein product [Orchesella dallaii]|uniref:PHD finger protein 12 n=1 Tax=Orchesella dallaii TaxID=48710 RepID=A0ABP1RL36_9HEXA